MTATTTPFHGSYSLQDEWKASCKKAMGYDGKASDENAGAAWNAPSSGPIVLNLLEEEEDDDSSMSHDDTHSDPWIENATRIDMGMKQIMSLLKRKKSSYLSASNSDDTDASLLESTLLTFVATTANQLESLRQSISSAKGHDYEQHCSGIVACLLLTLRQDIAEPFGMMQKQRSRAALALYQCPLQCRILLDQKDSRDITFLPEEHIQRTTETFMNLYDPQKLEVDDLSRPKSIMGMKTTHSPEKRTAPPLPKQKKQQQQQQIPRHQLPYQEQPELPPSHQQETLMQEALLLQANLTGELDAVQQVEARMTEITALLSQFSALVSEQQQEIDMVYESTVQSKNNVQKGQDSLVDAAQRTKQSKHRMATVVFLMALTLLFFNHFTP